MHNAPSFHITRRNLPHWQMDGATYFITFRLITGELSPAGRHTLFRHILTGNSRFYDLSVLVLMPDHAHLLLRHFRLGLPRITKGIKGVSAKLINDLRGRRGSLWQDESFDRIIRDEAEFQEKLQYMLNNPVKRDLIPDGWDWPWWHVASTQ